VAAGLARDMPIDPKGFGAHDAFELATIRGAEAIGKGAGDSGEMRIRLDRRDRTPETPSDLHEALAEAAASAAWEALAPSRRKELLVWLADAKRDQTRAARIGRIVQTALTEGTPRLV